MKILKPEIDLKQFYRQLKKASHKLLILDYDGTLAPFHTDPSKAFPYSGITEILNEIMKSPRVNPVIVSGRWTKDLIPLLGLDRVPELWGSHGIERFKKDGTYEVLDMDETALEGLVRADEWIDGMGLSNRSENKPGCLAIHWRGLNSQEVNNIKTMIEEDLTLIVREYGLDLKEFDGGVELRVPGRNKGDAVKTLLDESPSDSVAAYLGDDITDEDAFDAINEKGLSVLVRDMLRRTSADIWIRPPDELIEFLACWLPKNGN